MTVTRQLFFYSYILIFYLQEALLFQVLIFIMNKIEVIHFCPLTHGKAFSVVFSG